MPAARGRRLTTTPERPVKKFVIIALAVVLVGAVLFMNLRPP